MSYRRFALVALAAVLSVRTAGAANCNLNPSGPDQITLESSGAGSDFDIGWKGAYHDYGVPDGGLFEACLEHCDGVSDTLCDVNGYASGQAAGGRAFLPPIPIAIGSVAVCAVTTFEEPFATGTADVATGEIDVTAQFAAKVYNIQIGGSNHTNVCPVCSGANPGDTGTCSSGANAGGACTTTSVIAVQNTTDGPYKLSRDCLPSGGAASTAFSVHFTNGTATINGSCDGQSSSNDCGAGTCQAGVCNAGSNGGNRQACCSNNHNKSCFESPLTRTGVVNVPSPALPDTSYPKTATGTAVGTFCAPATGNILVDPAVGLAGPGAFVLPVDVTWDQDDSPVTTTTTTIVTTTTTTTTLPPCTDASQCSDSDPCTDDVCSSGVCSNPPASGAAAVSCTLGKVNPATLCGDDPVDAALQASITAQIAKAKGLLDEIAAAPAKRQKKLRNAAKKALAPILKKAAKAAKKKTISAACGTAIKDLVKQLQATIAAI